MATRLQIRRSSEKPPPFARCELCQLRQRAHFNVGHFPGHHLCVRCGLYLEMFPTKFISPVVVTKKPKNRLAKLLCKSALISAIPLGLHALGATTTVMISSIPFITLSAMGFCDDVVLNDAIDLALYFIKRPLRVLASRFYVSVNDVVTELFERHRSQSAGDIDQVSSGVQVLNLELRQIKLRQLQCEDRFLDDLGLDHLPRTLIRDALKKLVLEQLQKNKQRNERSNEASGEQKDEANKQGNERSNEASGERKDEAIVSHQTEERGEDDDFTVI